MNLTVVAATATSAAPSAVTERADGLTVEPAVVLSCALAALAVMLVVPWRTPRPVLLRRVAVPGEGGAPAGPTGEARDDAVVRHRALVATAAGAAPVLLIGGAAGLVAGVVVAGTVHRVLARREPARERRRREAVTRSLPQVVDLLGVALSAGADPSSALEAVADVVGGPAAAELQRACHGLRLGRDPVTVWRELAERPGMAALGRAMARAVLTGASVSDALHHLADDLGAGSRMDAESRARSVGVRAAAPLGLCLLPAFILIGIVPLVAGTVTALLQG